MERRHRTSTLRSEEPYDLCGEGDRRDQTPLLGRGLSPRETQFYLILCTDSVDGPSSVERLYNQIYGKIVDKGGASSTIGNLVLRVKAKLGEEAIITLKNLGYLSRRTLILNRCKTSKEFVPSEGIEPPSYP